MRLLPPPDHPFWKILADNLPNIIKFGHGIVGLLALALSIHAHTTGFDVDWHDASGLVGTGMLLRFVFLATKG
jgi:hypothetical protein